MPDLTLADLSKQPVAYRVAHATEGGVVRRSATRRGMLAIVALSLLLASGCGPSEKIESYTVAHEKTADEKAAEQPKRDPTDRMLATILPQGEQAWFFKLAGPRDAATAQVEDFLAFLQSVRFDNPKSPKWTLPEGWTEQPGSGMRYATILVPSEPKPLELTITTLPWDAQDETASILSNVNRWRGQMQLPPIGAGDIAKQTKQVPIAGATATFVVLDGNLGAGGGMGQPPFAGGPGAPSKPKGPVTPEKPAPSSAPSEFTYEVPKGWSPGTMNAMRKAAFAVTDGDQKIEITISTAGGDLLANINRWRGQIGLDAMTQSELDQQIKKLKIGKSAGDYIELTGPADAPRRQSIYGVVVVEAGQTWFFKLVGDTALAEREKSNFESFVQSVKFNGAEGSGNGQ
jgi:hypothetical protein